MADGAAPASHLSPGQGVNDDSLAPACLPYDHGGVASHHDLVQLDHFVHLCGVCMYVCVCVYGVACMRLLDEHHGRKCVYKFQLVRFLHSIAAKLVRQCFCTTPKHAFHLTPYKHKSPALEPVVLWYNLWFNSRYNVQSLTCSLESVRT